MWLPIDPNSMRTLLLLVMVALLAATSMGFFLPGMAPTAVRRTVGSSSTTQVNTDWMDGSIPAAGGRCCCASFVVDVGLDLDVWMWRGRGVSMRVRPIAPAHQGTA